MEKREVNIGDEEVALELESMREKNARLISVEDRGIKVGDTAIIDFKGFIDGEAFEGGEGTNHPLEIGSGQFIPGFEDQLVGVKVGEDAEVAVSYTHL